MARWPCSKDAALLCVHILSLGLDLTHSRQEEYMGSAAVITYMECWLWRRQFCLTQLLS